MSNQKQNRRFTPSQAVARAHQGSSQSLTQNKVDMNTHFEGNTSLHWAVIDSEEYIIERQLDNGANIHARNYNNYTPLEIAVQNNKISTASLLIKRGALVSENFKSLLLMAIDQNNYEIVKMIIDYGMQDHPSVNLIISLQATISKRSLIMIKAIIPHCGFSKPSDLYIPRYLVMKPGLQSRECIEFLLEWNFTIHPDSHHDEEFVYTAVENGYLPIVVLLLNFGINVNMVNSRTGLNLLTIACLNEHHEIVEKLLEHNADVNVSISAKNERLNNNPCFKRNVRVFSNMFALDDPRNDVIDVTCLHIAVFNSDLTTTKILFKYGATIIDDTELFNLTGIATKNGCKEIVDKFLNLGVRVTDINPHGQTLLHFCISSDNYDQNSNYDVARLLLEKGANIYLQTPGNNYLFEAIENRYRKIAKLFLSYHVDVQYISPNGDTSLHKAIKYHFSAKFIKNLLKQNSPVNTVNSAGFTPLHDACIIQSKEQSQIIEALLNHNADVNYTDGRLISPLFIACHGRNLQIVEMLLNKGANLHALNHEGQTPLHVACKSKSDVSDSIVQLLLQHGADIEAVDNHDLTPLMLACNQNNYKAVSCLLDHYADPNHTDSENSTPLHVAVKQVSSQPNLLFETLTIVQLLIANGANIYIVDRKNQTPIHLAVEKMIFYSKDNLRNATFLWRRYEIIIKILVSQGIKLKTAGLKVNNRNSNTVYNPDDYIIIDNRKFAANNILQLNVASDFDNIEIRGIEISDGENVIDNIRQLRIKCEQEIKQMEKENIGIDDLTFYDLLKKKIRFLSRLVKNENSQQLLKTEVYSKKFPLYIGIVRSRLRDAKICYEQNMLKMLAIEYFTLNINQQLPEECIDMILSYLNIRELKMFIETMKSLECYCNGVDF